MKKKIQISEMEAFGGRIQKMRKKRGLTQEEVADQMGCSLTYISKLEHGRATCNLARLFQLANVLECDAADLLRGANRSSKEYLLSDIAKMLRKLSPNDREVIELMIRTMAQRAERENAEYALP